MSERPAPRTPVAKLPALAPLLGRVLWLAGIALGATSFYVLTGPGRIDIIDGQFRFDVAYNLLLGDGPVIKDPALWSMSPVGSDGRHYAFYSPGSSYLGIPLVALGRWIEEHPRPMMFFFSFCSALAGGASVAAYAAIGRMHGFSRREVLACCLLLLVASPQWFIATTVFHQAQYVALLMLGLAASCWAARRESSIGALMAGALAGLSVFIQESAAVLVPWVAAPFFLSKTISFRKRVHMLAWCALASCGGLVLLLLANQARFGSPFDTGKLRVPGHPPVWGSGWFGAAALTFSIGKSWVLYCPIYLAAALGLRQASRESAGLAVAVGGICVTEYVLDSNLTFFGGDWAWGPRYLMSLAPIALLPLPWSLRAPRLRSAKRAVVALSFAVQLVSVSVDHQRFFLERTLKPHFWYDDPSFYYRESQLFARFDELSRMRLSPYPRDVVRFRPGPYQGLSTYTTFGGLSPRLALFPVFQLPRPWPLWMPLVPAPLRPVDPILMGGGCLVLGMLGALLVRSGPAVTRWGLRRRRTVPKAELAGAETAR